VDSSVVGYDGARNVMDEEIPVERKEPNRKQSEETKQSRWGFRGMTVRDWMDLLIVPLVLVVIGLVFTMLQDARQQDLENQRAQQAQNIENQRAKAERELADQRAQDEALQAYLDQMSQLMLDRKLLEAESGDPVHTLAQARTSTVILRLDAEHNKSVTRFLSNSGLTASSEASAKLLRDITLPHATLGGADLPNADLSGADLHGANLSNADLSEANLSADFLREANLSGADLLRANLSLAYLERANLSGANLHRANLRGATALTDDKIAAAEFLGGATMPNGQKYEDWLKSESRE
jgi:uncharacterized protein YjbI with pentapeptide repeats